MPRLVEDNNITIEPVFPVFGFLLGYLARFPFVSPFLIAVSQFMSNLAWQNWVNLVKAPYKLEAQKCLSSLLNYCIS